jgi:transcriptional regulator with XRE-family HTH domain
MEQVGDRVGTVAKRIRGLRGETLREVAERAGISHMYLSRIERLISTPSETTIRQLAGALEVPVSVLFGEHPIGYDPSYGETLRRLDDLANRLEAALRDLHQKRRNQGD